MRTPHLGTFADNFSSGLRHLTMAALLVVSGRAECDPTGSDEAAAIDPARDGCQSVVFVYCPPARQQAAAAPSSGSPLKATQQNLDARRFRPAQGQPEQGGAIEVTGARPTETPPDPWVSFGQSVQSSATPDCLGPSTQGGLLRLPFLLYEASVGRCR